jgi:hypothetical protein
MLPEQTTGGIIWKVFFGGISVLILEEYYWACVETIRMRLSLCFHSLPFEMLNVIMFILEGVN